MCVHLSNAVHLSTHTLSAMRVARRAFYFYDISAFTANNYTLCFAASFLFWPRQSFAFLSFPFHPIRVFDAEIRINFTLFYWLRWPCAHHECVSRLRACIVLVLYSRNEFDAQSIWSNAPAYRRRRQPFISQHCSSLDLSYHLFPRFFWFSSNWKFGI